MTGVQTCALPICCRTLLKKGTSARKSRFLFYFLQKFPQVAFIHTINNLLNPIQLFLKNLLMQKKIKPINHVRLIGRVSSIQKEKKLPSGDFVKEFRIVIARGGKNPSFDVLDIAVWNEVLRKKVRNLEVDSWLEISGSLRRRFWQGTTGVSSRWQVEAQKIKLDRKSTRRTPVT